MKFDLASVTSQDMSSAWVDALPKLVQRRGGIAVPMAGTLRNYSDSGIPMALLLSEVLRAYHTTHCTVMIEIDLSRFQTS